jgi:hypothetical protein
VPKITDQKPDEQRTADPSLHEMAGELRKLAGQIAALQGELAGKLAEYDAAGGWTGYQSLAAWASWHLGLPPGEARSLAKVAKKLPDLPVLSEACVAGTVPLAAAAMLSEVATPDNEAEMVDVARNATGNQLSKICRDYRAATSDHDEPPEPHVSLRSDRGGYRLGGWVPALAGDRLRNGLQAELDRLWDEYPASADEQDSEGQAAGRSVPTDDPVSPPGAREQRRPKPTRVDALMEMVERALADPSIGPERAERYLTMIHVDLDDHIRLDDGTPIDIDSFKKALGLSSFSWLLTIKGTPLWLTHKSRTPNRAMRRALRARDRCCAYPGCANVGYLESHHVVPYAQRQEAGLDGLALLCGFHHRWLHRRGESLVHDEDDRIVVKRSDGTVWTGKHPPPEAPDPPGVDGDVGPRPWAGDRLTHYARDVILEHLLSASAEPAAA